MRACAMNAKMNNIDISIPTYLDSKYICQSKETQLVACFILTLQRLSRQFGSGQFLPQRYRWEFHSLRFRLGSRDSPGRLVQRSLRGTAGRSDSLHMDLASTMEQVACFEVVKHSTRQFEAVLVIQLRFVSELQMQFQNLWCGKFCFLTSHSV